MVEVCSITFQILLKLPPLSKTFLYELCSLWLSEKCVTISIRHIRLTEVKFSEIFTLKHMETNLSLYLRNICTCWHGLGSNRTVHEWWWSSSWCMEFYENTFHSMFLLIKEQRARKVQITMVIWFYFQFYEQTKRWINLPCHPLKNHLINAMHSASKG